jgi:hypothetical protein
MNMCCEDNIVWPSLITKLVPIGSRYLLAGAIGWETLRRGGGFYQKKENIIFDFVQLKSVIKTTIPNLVLT